jgi:predicted nucleic acid-binding protein
MNVLFDTSVLVAAMVEAHPRHAPALSWLSRARAGEFAWSVCAHTLAELYAVLTTLPVAPRIGALLAQRMIHENVKSGAKVVALTPADYVHVVGALAGTDLVGGIVYDALILRTARKSGASHLLTLNPRDFLRLETSGELEITEP